MDLETAYLEHILLVLRTGDPDDSLLTTCMNSWFAHHKGQPFTDANNKPRWLSRKSSKRMLADFVHAASINAKKALNSGDLDDLVIDHTIPSAELIRGLRRRQLRQPFGDASELRVYLRKRFTLALLTKAEHDTALAECKSAMVGAWCDDRFDHDQSARYSRYGPDGGGITFMVQVAH